MGNEELAKYSLPTQAMQALILGLAYNLYKL